MTSGRPLLLGALVAIAQVVAIGGATQASSAADAVPPARSGRSAPTVSFRRDVAPVLSASCATRSCHGGGSRPPLLSASAGPTALRAALVGVASEARPDEAYVAPGRPGASFLLEKIDGTLDDAQCADHDCGEPMPADNPSLPAPARDVIRAWIAAGAPDD
jgi:hypothetical protein